MNISKNKLISIYIISSIIIVAISVYWYFSNLIFMANHPFAHKIFQNTIILSTRTLATIFVLYLAYLYKPNTQVGKFWLFLGLGLLLKTVGEFLFSYFLLFTDIPPFPSIADIFFLAAYPFWYLAFYIQIKLITVKLTLREKLFAFISFIIICILTVIWGIILPLFELYPLSSWEVFLLVMGASYPLCDLVLLIYILLLYFKFRKGKIEVFWILILLGFLIYLIANIIFSWAWVVVQIVTGYTITSLFQSIAHILFLNGALTVINLMKTEITPLNNKPYLLKKTKIFWMNISKNNLKSIYIISTIIIAAILVYWYFSNLVFMTNHPFEHRFFQSIIIISTRSLATILVIYLAYLYKIATKIGKFWLFLGLGLLSKTIGEILYQYFLVFTDIPAFPSIADIFFLAAYPFWYAAFYLQIKLITVKLMLREKIIVFGIFIVLCIFTFIMVIILPIYELYPLTTLDIFLLVMGALYPFCDLVFLINILILFTKLRKGKIEIAWILILLGFLIYLIANIIFNWIWAVVQVVVGYQLFDALISIGHILILNGALTMIYLLKSENTSVKNKL